MEVRTLRAWSRGEFDDASCYSGELTARRISDPARLARELGCSTDYLLGVTDQLTPEAEDGGQDGPWHWWPAEKPAESGLYWCVTGPMTHGGSMFWWNSDLEQWEHPAAKFAMKPSLTLWMKCPPLPESMAWERSGGEEQGQ